MTFKARPTLAKEIYHILMIAAIVGAGSWSLWGPGGYKDLKRAQANLEVRRARVEALQRSNDDRLSAIEALRSDRKTLEGYARGKGYGRKDEIIQRLPQEAGMPPRTR